MLSTSYRLPHEFSACVGLDTNLSVHRLVLPAQLLPPCTSFAMCALSAIFLKSHASGAPCAGCLFLPEKIFLERHPLLRLMFPCRLHSAYQIFHGFRAPAFFSLSQPFITPILSYSQRIFFTRPISCYAAEFRCKHNVRIPCYTLFANLKGHPS
jgi:hypothetical protein